MLDHILPFSSPLFFVVTLLMVLGINVAKPLLKKVIPFNLLIAVISASYIALWYPKPIQLLGLILFLYLVYLVLNKWYKSDNIVAPMLLLSIPIFLMKSYSAFGNMQKIDDFGNAVLIAGLSYMVFRVIGLYIDLRRESKPIGFVEFFNFTAFVPTLLIGPIDRYKRFQNDINAGYNNLTADRVLGGLNQFVLGLIYKFIIAEIVRRYMLDLLVNDSIFYHTAYAYVYLAYLFFDFAGYSLLAIGTGKMLGIDVPINFDKPFLAVNPKEFWKKWHKSLGDWLGDYFFKPIFKHLTSKKWRSSIQRQNMALFLTFTLMGFWNGFEFHFILSGVIFGLYSVIHNYYFYLCKKNKRDVFFGNLSPKVVRVLSIIIMVNAVAFSIYIFSGKLI